ncbi:MAG: hypothetical protein K8L97_32555 [Anaerolineae bacterium]|nr:hypothetical protein [Anaerolineae bacterium]
MHLAIHEVERFYSIWFPLLYYVNQQRKLVPEFPKVWGNSSVSPEAAMPLRDALWEDDRMRQGFIAENPANLSQDDLALVDSWKHRIVGDFFIFRYLKKFTVFVDDDSPAHGYGVLGLTSPIEAVVGPHLPIYVKAVLLPFEDRIIYDSLLSSYPIYFGSGYRSSLQDAYRDIQERGGIITRLPPETAGNNLESVRASNKKVLTAFQKALGMSGLSPKMVQEHTGNLATFVDDFLLKHTPPIMLLNITRRNIETYLKSQDSKVNLVSLKRFVRFLRDTGRVDWDEVDDLLNYLKRY